MPDTVPPVPHEVFDINRPRADGGPIARLPTLGVRPGGILDPQFRVTGVEDYHRAIHAAMGDGMRQIEGSLVEAYKALGAEPPQAMSYARLSFMPDPANYGLMQWPGMQPESLRKVARENALPQMVIRSRVADLRRYSCLSTHAQVPGWTVTLRDPKSTPGTQDLLDIREAERFIANCSREQAYKDPLERDAHHIQPFESFLCGAIDDSLTFDGWAIWTDRDNAGRVRSFANLPAGLIRLALPGRGYKGNPDVYAALVDETGTPAASFTREEMTWCVRNVRNDPNVIGYGWCYDSETEVLTNHGWKLFSAADIERDQFATMGLQTRKFEWQTASRKIWQSYVGKMYRLKSQSVDLLVTPNHRLIIKKHWNNDLVVMSAEEVFKAMSNQKKNNNWKLPIVSEWDGVEIADRHFNGIDSLGRPYQHPVDMSGDDYCAFMGMYLSEGYVPNNINAKNAYVCQREQSKGYAPFKEVLTRILGTEPYHCKGEFVVCRKALADHVKQFGRDCYTKHVPQEIMDATPRQIQIFLDYYLLGDGRTQKEDRREYKSGRRGRLGGVYRSITTTSRIMADQLQELIQKVGFAAVIHTRKAHSARMIHTSLLRNDGTAIAYDYVSEKAESYEICYKGSVAHGFTIEETTYAGDIGCVTVPNGTLYVRRNGRALWCGNSETEMSIRIIQAFMSAIELNTATFDKNGIPNGILKLMGDFWQQEQIDALQREWVNMKRGVSKMWGLPVIAVPEDGDIEMVSFMDMKGQEIRYKDHLNLMGGVYCIITQFPIRRWGMFASGSHRDNQPAQDMSTEIQGVDDPGLPAHLIFIEHRINEYILWPNWRHLQFRFEAKNPKEDARRYVERTKTRTWGEARAENDLPSLESLAKGDEAKAVAHLMSLCPEDPALVGAFQSMVATALESMLGIADDGADDAQPGSPNPGLKDPAASQSHGHRAGVPRSAAKERSRAKASEGATA